MIWKYLVAVILLGYAVVVLWLNIVGRWDYRGDGMSIEHGWPLVYMRRGPVYVPSSPPVFTNDVDATLAHRLPIDSARLLEFSTWRLLANLGVAAGGGIFVAVAGRFLGKGVRP